MWLVMMGVGLWDVECRASGSRGVACEDGGVAWGGALRRAGLLEATGCKLPVKMGAWPGKVEGKASGGRGVASEKGGWIWGGGGVSG